MKKRLFAAIMLLCSSSFLQAKEIDISFVKTAIEQAKRVKKKYGIPVAATTAMAIYESGYGTSDLAKKHHNYFGLKARSFQCQHDRLVILPEQLFLV